MAMENPDHLDECLDKADDLVKETTDLKEENAQLRQGAHDFKALAERLCERVIVEGRSDE